MAGEVSSRAGVGERRAVKVTPQILNEHSRLTTTVATVIGVKLFSADDETRRFPGPRTYCGNSLVY